MARKQAVCGHEPHHARGLCRNCHDFFRKQSKTNIAPPDVPDHLRAKVEAAGALVPREDKRFGPIPTTPSGTARLLAEEISPAIALPKPTQNDMPFDTSDPKVAAHIAGAVAKSLHDFKAAARMLRPDLKPADQATLAYQLEQDPYVRASLQQELEKLGLSDDAKKRFIALLWSSATDLRPQAEKDRSNARRLLARAFLPAENPSSKNEAPVPLPITNLDAGLDRMGLGDDVVASVQTTQTSNFEIDEDTQAEMDRED